MGKAEDQGQPGRVHSFQACTRCCSVAQLSCAGAAARAGLFPGNRKVEGIQHAPWLCSIWHQGYHPAPAPGLLQGFSYAFAEPLIGLDSFSRGSSLSNMPGPTGCKTWGLS